MNKTNLENIFSSEHAMCAAFWKDVQRFQMIGAMKPCSIFHVPNGQRAFDASRKSRKIAGYKDRMIGAISGVADYCVPGVGFLEAKIYDQKGKKTLQNKNQKEFESAIKELGCKYQIFRTPQEGIDILMEWGVIYES